MKGGPRSEWPMSSYITSWEIFRQHSDENEETAKHLLLRDCWPKKDRIIIGDLGCGDGLLLERVVHYSKRHVTEIRLLDPDQELLGTAKKNVARTRLVDNIKTFLNSAEDAPGQFWDGVDVVLMVHVAYLMREGSLEAAIRSTPEGISAYIVLDAPRSIFTRLWEHISQKYFERTKLSHSICKKLAVEESGCFQVRESMVTSHLKDPFSERDEVRDAILSILCYRDVRDMTVEEFKRVEDVVRDRTIVGEVICESLCYEVLRVKS